MNLLKSHVFVYGRVQGVFFRYQTKKKANELGLSGWVRNTNDGRVESVFIGPAKKVEKMLNWLNTGSPLSRVEKVEIISKQKVEKDEYSLEFTQKL